MEKLDQKKKKTFPEENERKQLSRGSSVLRSGGWCVCVCVLCMCIRALCSSVWVPPSGRDENCTSWDWVKLNREKISPHLLRVIKVFLWEHQFLERHHRCSPLNSYQQKKRPEGNFFFLYYWPVTKARCSYQVKYVSAYTVFGLELFLSLGFVVSIRCKGIQPVATARGQSSCPSSYRCIQQVHFHLT